MAPYSREDKPKPFIVRFYGAEAAKDEEGRTLDDILNYEDGELEYHHDYIQVLFPLPEPSPVNPGAPLIKKGTRTAFLESEELRSQLFRAFTRMAGFYAFNVKGDAAAPALDTKPDFRKLAQNTWLTRVDHNHLRISRIIRCLRILGLHETAQVFHQALQDNAEGVSSRSLMYWERAATRPLHLPPSEDNENAKGVAWLKPVEV
ncbi:hypothetical protein DOTSEDRAFT_43628 [Dothistroma septosporum NZE10]|uniref:Opioid growth factor receptor (OGFr) conserved domain-containing protein n=1 Tax=Dothistroma septosporum (strain NZE10 / CBS 128990) TaxID=675120 RepID=N1PPB3_DOTSN|nr:hypothetical protein DOTSEDRAFT_43628 [Dothistroma septosporum NZE10]